MELLNPPQVKTLEQIEDDQIEANIREYYPYTLSERQRTFLSLKDYEAFYGGAAGGGKSDALLAAAIQYVHVPGYRAIIFRRHSNQLEDLTQRSLEWWSEKAEWSQQKLRWTFPSGAMLYFGHMQYDVDKFKYKGPAFQFVGWDELTEFLRSQYIYLFSRVRRQQCQLHKLEPDPDCRTCQRVKQLSKVPLRVRSASNPDGEGREWVKARFVSDEAANAISSGEYGKLYWNEFEGRKIPFVPSRVEDNPGLDTKSYIEESLSALNPVERARLRAGDWNVRENGVVSLSWLRYYTMRGQIINILGDDGKTLTDANGVQCAVDERECRRFATVDTAGTTDDKEAAKKGRYSWSVVAIWDLLPAKFGTKLCLRHIWRKQVEWDGLKAGVRSVLNEWNPRTVIIENKHFGPPLIAELRSSYSVRGIEPGQKGKYERATDFLNMLEKHQVYFPQFDTDWLPTYQNELLSWRGEKDETNDQIDVSSYAAMEVQGGSSQTLKVDHAFWR
jgi:hypothetical protein